MSNKQCPDLDRKLTLPMIADPDMTPPNLERACPQLGQVQVLQQSRTAAPGDL